VRVDVVRDQVPPVVRQQWCARAGPGHRPARRGTSFGLHLRTGADRDRWRIVPSRPTPAHGADTGYVSIVFERLADTDPHHRSDLGRHASRPPPTTLRPGRWSAGRDRGATPAVSSSDGGGCPAPERRRVVDRNGV